jgi:hypothetical protein
MPAKKEPITEAERAKRIRETAREAETSNDPSDFERAFSSVAKGTRQKREPKSGAPNSKSQR